MMEPSNYNDDSFVLLDASKEEVPKIKELSETLMYDSKISELYLKGIHLNDDNQEKDDDWEADDDGLAVALRSMFQNRALPWDEVSIDNCTGVPALLSWVMGNRRAPVRSLLLDSIALDEKVASVLQKGILEAATPKLPNHRQHQLSELQLCDLEFTYIFAAPVLEAIGKSQSITSLVFNRCTFDQSAVVGLANALRACSAIRSLEISACGLSDKHAAILLRALRGHAGLERLDIRKNELSTESIAAVEGLLQSTTVLKSMDLTLPHDAEIASLDVSRKRRRVSKHRTLKLLYTRRDPLNDKGVEFSCSVSCELKA